MTNWGSDVWTFAVSINANRTAHYLSEDGKPFELFDTEHGSSAAYFGDTPMYVFNGDFDSDGNAMDKLVWLLSYFKSGEDVIEVLPASSGANIVHRTSTKLIKELIKNLGKGWQIKLRK